MYVNIHAYVDVSIMMHGDQNANQPWVAESRYRPPFSDEDGPRACNYMGAWDIILCFIFIWIYLLKFTVYIYTYKKNTFSDTCTHIHISDKRDFTLLSILSASSAAQLSNGSMCLLSSAVKTTGRDYRCFFSLLDSPLTPISHALSAFKKTKKWARTCT